MRTQTDTELWITLLSSNKNAFLWNTTCYPGCWGFSQHREGGGGVLARPFVLPYIVPHTILSPQTDNVLLCCCSVSPPHTCFGLFVCLFSREKSWPRDLSIFRQKKKRLPAFHFLWTLRNWRSIVLRSGGGVISAADRLLGATDYWSVNEGVLSSIRIPGT